MPMPLYQQQKIYIITRRNAHRCTFGGFLLHTHSNCLALPHKICFNIFIKHTIPYTETDISNIIHITDFSSPQLDVFARLSENQLLHYNEPHGEGLFIAESPNVIIRALDAGYILLAFLAEDKHIETQAKEIISRCADVPVYTAPFDVLTQLTGFQLTRGMLAAMQRKPLPTLEEICADKRRIAVLENVMNPTNIGAIFRSVAHCF